MPYLSLRDLSADRVLEFETDEVRIGRSSDLELVVMGGRSEVVSGSHARLFRRSGQWWLEDSGSRNGTFLGDEQLAPGLSLPLSAGSVIRLGTRGPRYRVEAVGGDRPEETLAEGPMGAQPAAATVPLESMEEAVPPGQVHVVLMEAKTGEQFKAGGGRVRIGRGKECELRPVSSDDTSVSRVHAEIVLKPDGRVVLRDAQSRNGTFLGNVRVQGDREIRVSDQIRLGPSGPELVVAKLLRPGEVTAQAAPHGRAADPQPEPKKKRRRESLAQRVAAKVGSARRSFGGKGATVFFHEMFAESSRKTARRVRWVIWLFVVLLAGSVGAVYWYGERRVRQATSEIQEQQRVALARLAARSDSMQAAADGEYDRLRLALDEARAGSAPAAVVESLRVELADAQEHTRSLEASLRRAEASLAEQLAAGDSVNRAAQADLEELRAELNRASTAGTSSALLDSLRQAVRDAEERSTQISSQMRAMRGSNLPEADAARRTSGCRAVVRSGPGSAPGAGLQRATRSSGGLERPERQAGGARGAHRFSGRPG
jgi:pSer/pThr/pTyr-binding forkhead associated (FHA) protein/CHASE3 domain sensor protein